MSLVIAGWPIHREGPIRWRNTDYTVVITRHPTGWCVRGQDTAVEEQLAAAGVQPHQPIAMPLTHVKQSVAEILNIPHCFVHGYGYYVIGTTPFGLMRTAGNRWQIRYINMLAPQTLESPMWKNVYEHMSPQHYLSRKHALTVLSQLVTQSRDNIDIIP